MNRGISFIEVITVAAISSIIILALVRFMAAGFPAYKTSYLQVQTNEVARLQLKRMAKALREMRGADTGAYPLVEASPQKIVFYSDVDGDNLTERIRYELVGEELTRGVITPSGDPLEYVGSNEVTSVVTSSVRNGSDPIFTYFDGDYPTETTPLTAVDVTEVKYIQFFLKIDVDVVNDPPPIEVRSQVSLRNLKTNLGET